MQQNNKHQKRNKYMRLSEVPTGQEVVIVKVLGYGGFSANELLKWDLSEVKK